MIVLEDGARLPARPRVSVLMLAYRHAPFIEKAVRSAVAQDAPFDWEIIVSDDASPDETPEILRRLQREFPQHLRVFLHERNLGGSGNRNFAFLMQQGRGEFLAILEGDDFWCHRAKLARQVAVMDSDPTLAGCFHAIWAMDETYQHVTRREEPVLRKSRFTFEDFIPTNHARTATLLVRRTSIPSLPGWFSRHLASDRCFNLVALEHGDYAYLPDAMAVYRIHPGGVWTGLTPVERSHHELRFYENLLTVYGDTHGALIRSIREQTRFWGARNACRSGDRAGALRLFARFLTHLPSSRHVPLREFLSLVAEMLGRPTGVARSDS